MPDYVLRRMSIIFDTWAERYAANPEEFEEILNADGVPAAGYGESCALYFEKLATELDAKGLLPRRPDDVVTSETAP